MAIMKQFKALSERWFIIAILFRVEIIFLCVCPKNLLKSKQFPNESQNRGEHEVVFPQLFVNKDTSVHNSSFYKEKYRSGPLVLVVKAPMCHLLSQKKKRRNDENYLNK